MYLLLGGAVRSLLSVISGFLAPLWFDLIVGNAFLKYQQLLFKYAYNKHFCVFLQKKPGNSKKKGVLNKVLKTTHADRYKYVFNRVII